MSLQLVQPNLEALRRLIGDHGFEERERRAFSLYPPGFAVGSVIEACGEGKTEMIAHFLREHPDFKVAWLERELSVHPYALWQRGVNLMNVLFVEAGAEIFWALTQVLATGGFQAVIVSDEVFAEKDLRRLQLLAEKSQASFFILSEVFHSSWVPQLQLTVGRRAHTQAQTHGAELDIRVSRKRGVG